MKKITALAVSLFLVFQAGPLSTWGETNQAFLQAVAQTEEGSLRVFCALPEEAGNAGEFEVTLGEQPLLITASQTAGEAGEQKALYCLVDISGSMKGRMDQVKETLAAISGGLAEGDQLILGKMGNQITDSPVLTDGEAIRQEIGALQYTGEDTDLYSGLIHGLSYLRQEPGLHTHRALVVLSDGCDDQGAGSTWREAYEAAQNADIPIYTVAVILSERDYEPAKELGSFGRISAGGRHFPTAQEGSSKPASMTGEEMGAAVIEAMEESLVLTVDLSGSSKPEKDTCMLSVACRGEGGRLYQDSKELAVKDIRFAEPQAEPQTEPQTEPEKEETEAQPVEAGPEKEDKGMSVGVLAGAGILVAVIAAAAAFAVRKRKEETRKRQEEERIRKEEEERERLADEKQKQERLQKEQQAAQQKAREEAMRREQEAFMAAPRLKVRMSAIGRPDKQYSLELVLGYEMSVGRNSRAMLVLDGQDSRLSSAHFIMLWDGKSVYVWDNQSRNGTAVNGVVANHLGRVAVKPGDSIRAGSYEYRMYWEETR